MNSDIKLILKVAATYIGTIVGAGFATGKEIVTFFSINGWYGSLGILICTIFFSYLGTKIMILAAAYKANSIQEFNDHVFGKKLGSLLSILIAFGVLTTTSVMLSGAGTIFRDQFNIPKMLGILLVILFLFYIVQKGIDGVFEVNSIVVPTLITFVLLATFFTFNSFFINLLHHPPLVEKNYIKIISNPFTYVALNISLAQIVLIPLGNEIQDKKILTYGGILGGIGLGGILLLCHVVILGLDRPLEYNLPMAAVIHSLHPILHFLFLFIILGEIITTLVGNMYGLTKQLQSLTLKISNTHATLLILGICYFISYFEYGVLLNILYPLIGWLTLIFIPIVAIKKNH